jgi:hypothetical protein
MTTVGVTEPIDLLRSGYPKLNDVNEENRRPALQRNVEIHIALPMHSLKLCTDDC